MNYLHVERQDDGIVLIRFDDPEDRMNKLSSAMISELDLALKDIENDPALQGVILLSNKKDNFLVGADLKEIAKIQAPGIARELIKRVHAIFERIESLPIPVLAAIHGHCLGGGMELTLACHYRIATDHSKTRLGLPEVKLGLIPAGGGTQRLPRIIGLRKALPLMLEGRTLSPSHAKALGMIDIVVHPYDLLETARKCIFYLKRRPARGSAYPKFGSFDWVLSKVRPLGKSFFNLAGKQVEHKTMGNYPALMRLLECVETGFFRGLSAGFEAEAEAFDELVLSEKSRALRELFFATTTLKKNPILKLAKPIRQVGVLGSGFMGSGIAAVSARAGLPVLLKDVSWSNLAHGLKNIWTYLDERRKKERVNPVERDKTYSLIVPTEKYDRFSSIDLVIEAVFEDLPLKQRVLKEVEEHSSSECIFASNTSAIPISRIAASSRRPETVIGMHYFSPAPRMPLLEVVATPETAKWVTATAMALGQRQGKSVIVVKDGPGFYTSRILAVFIHEAVNLLHERADIRQVDEAMRRFGFPVGPFKLLDEVGIDVAAHVSEELGELFSKRDFSPSESFERLIAAGFQGRKNGSGFYRYGLQWWEKKPHLPGIKPERPINREVYRYFGGKTRKNMEQGEIVERLVLLMANEAVLCLQEGIISAPVDGDVGAVLGLGFPPFLGGPFRYLDSFGAKEAVSRLDRLSDRLGKRFQPASFLVDMAKNGNSFYKS